MKKSYILILFFSIIIFSGFVSADSWTLQSSSLNIVYLDTDTLYGGNSIIIDKVSSTTGSNLLDRVPLVRYNLGTSQLSSYSQYSDGTNLTNWYNVTVWNNPSYGLYPSKVLCQSTGGWFNVGVSNTECGGLLGVNTYWKSSSLELYVQRKYSTNPSLTSTNLTIYKRDNVNNYWTKITDFYSFSDGIIFGGQTYLQSTFDPMYNLLNLYVGQMASLSGTIYQPQHLNTTNNGWYHDTNYNGFTYNLNEDMGKIWKIQKSTADTSTKILAGRWIFSSTYPSGDAHYINTSFLPSGGQDLIGATWINGNESRYIWSYNSGVNLEIFQTDGWTQEPSQIWTPINHLAITDITSCIFIKNYGNVEIRDIDCKDNNECVFVGHYNSGGLYSPLLVKYNGQDCQVGSLTGTPTNSTIESVVYEPNTDAYYVGGRKLFGKFRFTTDIPSGNVTIYPVCMPNAQLCVNPWFIGSTPYCSENDLLPCEGTCVNTYNVTLGRNVGYCNTTVVVENCSLVPYNCFIAGQTICQDISTYLTCAQNVNYNTCYTYQYPTPCPVNTACSNGVCVTPSNESNVTLPNATGYIYVPNNFTVILLKNPQVTATDGTVISANDTYFTGLSYTGAWWCLIPTPLTSWYCLSKGQSVLKWNYNNNNPPAVKVVGLISNVNPILQFNLINNIRPSYMASVCSLNPVTRFLEEFNYSDSITNHGWVSSCNWFPDFYDVNNPSILFLNGSDPLNISAPCTDSNVHYTFNSSNVFSSNAEFDFTVFPPHQAIGASQNGSVIVALGSQGGYLASVIEVEFSTSGLTNEPVSSCIYYYDSGYNKNLLWCYNSVVTPIVVQVYINFDNRSYSISTAEQFVPSTLTRSSAIDFLYPSLNDIGSVWVNPYGFDLFGVGNLMVTQFSNPNTLASNGNLDLYGANSVLFNCQYQDVGAYTSRFYNSVYPNVLNNYFDFGTQKILDFTNGVPPDTLPEDFEDRFQGQPAMNATASFFDSLFGGDTGSSASSRFFYSFIFIFFSVVVCVVLLGYSSSEYGLNLSGGFIGGFGVLLAIGELIMFSFLGYIPAWIIILFAIVASGIIALIIKNLVSGSSG